MSGRRSGAARTISLIILGAFIVVVVLAEFIAPYDVSRQSRAEPNAPASNGRLRDEAGNFTAPYIFRRELADPLAGRYEEVPGEKFRLGLFVQGEPYYLLGVIPARTHLFGVEGAGEVRLNVLGTDALGRDRLSRLIVAVKFSLIVCPIGAAIAWLIGVFVGLVSGYSGRLTDSLLMGTADTVLALPILILILAARAAFPIELPPERAAVLLIAIFSLAGWADTARLTRGLVRALREREFILAAKSTGLSEARILFRHLLPNALPTLANHFTVMLPFFLLSEVALSFLGVGLQEPQPSLGNMLAAAADLTQLQRHPFLLLSPGIVIFIFVLAVRLLALRGEEARS